MWNYRVVVVDGFKEVCEVYYNADNKPYAYCQASISGESFTELLNEVDRITTAIYSEFLVFPEDFEYEGEYKDAST